MIQSTPGAAKVLSDQLYLVYHKKKGDIIHAHRVTILEGGQPYEDSSISSRAIEHAAKLHRNLKPEHVAVIITDPKNFSKGHSHSVDIKTLRLVSVPKK